MEKYWNSAKEVFVCVWEWKREDDGKTAKHIGIGVFPIENWLHLSLSNSKQRMWLYAIVCIIHIHTTQRYLFSKLLAVCCECLQKRRISTASPRMLFFHVFVFNILHIIFSARFFHLHFVVVVAFVANIYAGNSTWFC